MSQVLVIRQMVGIKKQEREVLHLIHMMAEILGVALYRLEDRKVSREKLLIYTKDSVFMLISYIMIWMEN
jgi:hypothetical protein